MELLQLRWKCAKIRYKIHISKAAKFQHSKVESIDLREGRNIWYVKLSLNWNGCQGSQILRLSWLKNKGNKALKSEILSRSSPHFLISRHDLKILNQNWGSMFGDSKQINWEAGNSNLLFLSNFLEMTCSKFPILRLYYL